MADFHKNFAYSLVATAPSPATSGTSLVVTAGQGALFPTPPFNLVIWPTAAQPLSTNAEIVRVTAISTDTLTIVRAQEGTSARTVVVGDQVSAAITAKTLQDLDLEEEVTGTTKTMVPNTIYRANNGSQVVFTLPASANTLVGDILEVRGVGAGGWKIAQNASQLINFIVQTTTTGTGGSITSVERYARIRLEYVASNTWNVIECFGNFTLV